MLSAHGRCHTFDERGDGYCRGEGCVVAILSRREDNDPWITAIAVRNDGPSASLTAPNGSA